VTTHGVMPYDPSPIDSWRGTHPGVEKLFAENGPWASVRVTTASGTTVCLGMLYAMYFDLGFRRLDERGPGGLFANFHIVAEVAR
jgi:hypothetical protein